jgi:hypothetical protein
MAVEREPGGGVGWGAVEDPQTRRENEQALEQVVGRTIVKA